MKIQLRQYLESIGLSKRASKAAAWKFYNDLEGAERQHAEALQRGRSAPENCRCEHCGEQDPPADEGQRSDPPTDDPALAERQRIRGIQELAIEGTRQEWIDHCVERGLTVEQSSLYFLQQERALRDDPVGLPAIHSRDHERDCTERALQAGFMIRCSINPVNANATERVRAEQEQFAEQGDRYRGFSMARLAEESLRISGRNVPHDRNEMVRAAVSTPTFSNIFTTSVNARLIMGWQETPDSTVGWTREEDVADFKTQDLIGLGKSSNLQKLSRGSKAAHATISDNVESYKIARYANQFVMDEQDIIDDRINAIMQMPFEMGQAARRLRPDLVYAIILSNPNMRDGNALFDTNHSNQPSDAALSASALEAHIESMGKQTEDGVNLNIMPRYLLVPQDLKFTGRIILQSAERRGDSANADGTINPLQDEQIELRVDNRLGAAGFTNPDDGATVTGSATNWYLSAAASRTIVVGFLAGTNRQPQVRRFTLDQGQWGIGWDIKLDIGAKAEDWRGLDKSAGTG